MKASLYLFRFAAIFVFSDILSAQVESELETLKTRFEERLDGSFTEERAFGDQYIEELKGLEAKAVEKGDLDLVLAVKAEIENFRNLPEPALSAQTELAKLQQIFRNHRKELEGKRLKKVEALTAEYKFNLVELRAGLTRAGRLEDAIEVQRELDSMNNEDVHLENKRLPSAATTEPSHNPDDLHAVLTSRKWVRKQGGQRDPFTFHPNGELSSNFGSTWKTFTVEGSKLTITKENGISYVFGVTSQSPYVLTGESAQISGMTLIEIE